MFTRNLFQFLFMDPLIGMVYKNNMHKCLFHVDYIFKTNMN